MMLWLPLRRPRLVNRAYEPLHNSLSTLSISKGHHLLPSAYRQPSVRYSIRYDSTSATESKKPDSISTSRPSDASSNGLSKASMAKPLDEASDGLDVLILSGFLDSVADVE